jgi:hypothetical protein
MESKTPDEFTSVILNMLQDAVDADIEEYHQLRYRAKNHPSLENIELFKNKRQELMHNFKFSEKDLECLNKEFDQRRFKMFYGPSPHGQ